ncbi:hypothetical protein D7I47_02490 [Protaetiibacter intestinalis]|uniref:MmyB-like transcription regulator ligand binding domain-containing protein n=1 Tax=Protaetiibacter intestinalis TaxID=2419774 RepID=A0A387B4I4_9MICO|nr:hypothetical protein D7I47_02490 [Protaetiibacter intestinalis]
MPAFMYDKHMTVVAANSLARRLDRVFEPGNNLVLDAFRPRDGGPPDDADLRNKRDQAVAVLRASLRRHPEDGVFLDIVGELAATSAEFSSLWASTTPMKNTDTITFQLRPGESVKLTYHRLEASGRDGEVLVIFHPADQAATRVLDELITRHQGAAE